MITGDIDKGTDGVLNAGDNIEYIMEVTNTGSACLMDVTLKDEAMTTIACAVEYKGWSTEFFLLPMVRRVLSGV